MDFSLPSRCAGGLRSSAMLRGLGWQFVTDVQWQRTIPFSRVRQSMTNAVNRWIRTYVWDGMGSDWFSAKVRAPLFSQGTR